MIKIIKWLLIALIVLVLIGSVVNFQTSDESWAFIIDKNAALKSIQNGIVKIYDFFVYIIKNLF